MKSQKTKMNGQTIFYAVFAIATLILALFTFMMKIPNSPEINQNYFFLIKLCFFCVFMILNATFTVKCIQSRGKGKVLLSDQAV